MHFVSASMIHRSSGSFSFRGVYLTLTGEAERLSQKSFLIFMTDLFTQAVSTVLFIESTPKRAMPNFCFLLSQIAQVDWRPCWTLDTVWHTESRAVRETAN